MFAIEFKTKIKNGVIELPKRFRDSITDTVKVIILKEVPPPHETGIIIKPDIIEKLLASPLEIQGFHAMKRNEIYAR